jgi:adenylyltransferase/sulfurtransferase
MATETVKLILDRGTTLVGRLMLYDSLRMSFKDVKIRRNPKCELCGDNPTVTELVDYEAFCDIQLPGVVAQDDSALEVTPQDLKHILDVGRPITLLDVREPHEWDIARIEQARLTPLSQFESFIPDLKRDDEIYLYCYKGKRSMTALKKLSEAGFDAKRLRSLAGGIDRWAEEVEPEMPRY